MSLYNIILGAAYIGPYEKWGWVRTLGVIAVGVILFWILYKLVLSKINWKTGSVKKEEKVESEVITDEDMPDENGITHIHAKEESEVSEEVIVMPFSGELMELEKVPDPIFSEKMVGDGFAVRPSKEDIFSPVNGYVEKIQSNRSSITFNTLAGREVILHIGLDANLERDNGISLDIKEGDKVSAGHLIGRVNLDKLVLNTKSPISPVIFPKLKEYEHLVVKQIGIVDGGMKGIIVIEINEK